MVMTADVMVVKKGDKPKREGETVLTRRDGSTSAVGGVIKWGGEENRRCGRGG